VTFAAEYFRIAEDAPLPDIAMYRPFRAVIILEGSYSDAWQQEASRWLVESGCLYMLAWGEDCSSWDDSVDWAILEEFSYGDIPDGRDVMTTWHENEPLEQVFWFAMHCANHSDVKLANTLILHVSPVARRDELLGRFHAAQTR
jgi:hypothetical protein